MTSAVSGFDVLQADIDACGYFPHLVGDAVRLAVGDEGVRAHLVHHEATFNRDEIHRHITVLAMTDSRLIVSHTDENDEEVPGSAATTTESIPLRRLGSVALTQVVAHPEKHGTRRSSGILECWLTVSWGTMRRIDIETAHCGDPDCEADHGYSGTMVGDDLTVRISAAGDGEESVGKLVRFATALQRATDGR